MDRMRWLFLIRNRKRNEGKKALMQLAGEGSIEVYADQWRAGMPMAPQR